MRNKGLPKLSCIVIDIFGEVQHNGNPHIVWCYLDVFMIVVGLKKGPKEAIIKCC